MELKELIERAEKAQKYRPKIPAENTGRKYRPKNEEGNNRRTGGIVAGFRFAEFPNGNGKAALNAPASLRGTTHETPPPSRAGGACLCNGRDTEKADWKKKCYSRSEVLWSCHQLQYCSRRSSGDAQPEQSKANNKNRILIFMGWAKWWGGAAEPRNYVPPLMPPHHYQPWCEQCQFGAYRIPHKNEYLCNG